MIMNKLKKELLTQKKLKELQVNLAKEFGLDQVIKRDKLNKEFDEWLNNLIKNNGSIKY